LGNLGTLGTQVVSNINSKYLKGTSHHQTDLNNKNRGLAGFDLLTHSAEAIPFSMVSSQIHNPKTEENVGDLTTEIL
jgi:hypothetical protein